MLGSLGYGCGAGRRSAMLLAGQLPVLAVLWVLALSGCRMSDGPNSTAAGGDAADSKQPQAMSVPPLSDIMRQKMVYAQMALEGLVQEDFGKIGRSAAALRKVSEAKAFNTHKTLTYVAIRDEFRHVADELAKHATDKNIDAATLSYVQMTLNCVKCHNYTRRDEPGLRGAWAR